MLVRSPNSIANTLVPLLSSMEKHYLPIILALASLLLAIAINGRRHGETQTYIIHVLKPTGMKHLDDSERESWHLSFLPNATLGSGSPRLVYSYRDAISGFAARLTSDEVQAMESMDGFMHAHLETRLSLATTHTPSFLGLPSQWDSILWPESLLGQGIVIGVVDGGITPDHPSFEDDGTLPPRPPKWRGRCDFRNKSLCNHKLIGATAFRRGTRESPVDEKDDGHGTHIAGIAAGSYVSSAEVLGQAKGVASGIAPRAHIAVYKACYDSFCYDSDVLAAVDEAIKDGVDVLSVSISGSVVPLYHDSLAIASLSAVTKGIFPCLAVGNSGPYRSSVTNSAPWVMTVGASSHDRRISAVVRLGDGTELEGESVYQLEIHSNSTTDYWPLDFPGLRSRPARWGCEDFDVDVKGNIVMCVVERLDNTHITRTIKAAGGAAVVLLNSFIQGSTTIADNHALPSAQLSYKEALKLVSYFKSNPNPTATIIFNGTRFGARPSPGVAYFSSRGPSLINGGILKPDVVAPGVNIMSAWPNSTGSSRFNFLSGTSVATPHIAGIVALLKNSHPKWSPAAIRSAIMTTADRLDLDGRPIVEEYQGDGQPADLFAMGSGQVNPLAANDPGLVYDLRPYKYVHYLCGLGYGDDQVSVIAQHRIMCSNTPNMSAEELNYPSISVLLGSNSKKKIERQVTNVGDANEVYWVEVEEPNGVRVDVHPNKLMFFRVGQRKTFRIEFSVKSRPLYEGHVSQGQLLWISNKHLVRSPISVTSI